MVSPLTLVAAAVAVFASPIARDTPEGVLAVPFDRVQTGAINTTAPGAVRRRRVADLPEPLQNAAFSYLAGFQLGTPGQSVQALIDTGSSDLWVFDSSVPDKDGASFNRRKSSTYRLLERNGFDIEYVEGSAHGDLVSDTFGLGGAALPNAEFAVVNYNTNDTVGVWGIGLTDNEAVNPEYANVPVLLKNRGYIKRNAYSLYLNSAQADSGTLLFGGIDTAKYSGKLNRVPIENPAAFAVTFEFLGQEQQGVLDSGTTGLYVANNTYFPAIKSIKSWVTGGLQGSLEEGGFYTESLSNIPADKSFTITINNVDYQIPLRQLFVEAETDDGASVWALIFFPGGDANQDEQWLGDAFLHAVYVVYDLDSGVVALAPAKYTSDSNIVAIPATGIPANL